MGNQMESSGSSVGTIVGVMFFLMIVAVVIQVIRKSQAKNDYDYALQQFRSSPTDPKLRQGALQAGRSYSRMTRNAYGVTYFDEVAIKNDIDAIEAAAVKQAPTPVVDQLGQSTIAERLKTLDELHGQGLITEDEYADRRRAILEEI